MKLIKQSFEILEQKDFTLKGIKQFIEKCGALWHTEDEIPKADRLIITKGRNYKDEYTMYDEALRDKYGNEVCELCCREYFTNRAFPEALCEGRYCEGAEDSFADEHNIELED